MYRPRQFVQIASLPGESFFESLAEGVALIGKHVVALNQAIDKLAGSGGDVAARILEMIAREEIGKMLVLIDAARIDRRRANLISNQLKRAGDHLGKALYYEATNGSPATIGEVQSYIDSLRDSLYLDGPNGFDWVFRNSLIADREDAMYVDLHKTAAGLHWNDPSAGCLSGSWYPPLPFRLALALLSAGFGTLTGFGIINELWKGFVVRLPDDSGADRGTHWQEVATLNRSTVEALLKAGVASELTDEDAGLIHEHWTFPLYSLQLGKRDINESEIAKQQRRRERAFLWEAAEYDDICAEMWSGSGAHEFITLADFTAQQREAFINEEDVPE